MTGRGLVPSFPSWWITGFRNLSNPHVLDPADCDGLAKAEGRSHSREELPNLQNLGRFDPIAVAVRFGCLLADKLPEAASRARAEQADIVPALTPEVNWEARPNCDVACGSGDGK